MSELANQAIVCAVRARSAIAKFIAPNDTKATRSHQSGYYLPKTAWKLFSRRAPISGENFEHAVTLTWHDDSVTNSVVKWYSKSEHKNEFRLTKFGREFPWRESTNVGDLLLIVPETFETFSCFVLETEEDIEEVLAGLGIDPASKRGWDVYTADGIVSSESDECIERKFSKFLESLRDFPTGYVISNVTRDALYECLAGFAAKSFDERLLQLCELEFNLFRRIERKFYGSWLSVPFASIDDFITRANTVLNRRKSRAGRALENHVEHILKQAGLSFSMRPRIDGRPDVVFPSAESYKNLAFPTRKLAIMAVKSTCKDRWRQVLREGKRVKGKYLLTTQNSISTEQLTDMYSSSVRLVVPKPLHDAYPKGWRAKLLSVEEFVNEIQDRLA